ncbi:MAG: DUF359 domain-containing protein [Nitrososphaerota archaeon]|nr:DUF359 domain-containing protein [Nitrososphaerota archaeon]
MADLHLSDSLRMRLKKPMGRLIQDSQVDGFLSSLKEITTVVTVGDHTTRRCEEVGIKPALEIIDYREKRSRTQTPENRELPVTRVNNPPGTITAESINAIRNLLSQEKRNRLVVEGEEDLLVIPCIQFAKPGSLVLYGQPNVGLVAVTVDEQSKHAALLILKEMGWSE